MCYLTLKRRVYLIELMRYPTLNATAGSAGANRERRRGRSLCARRTLEGRVQPTFCARIGSNHTLRHHVRYHVARERARDDSDTPVNH